MRSNFDLGALVVAAGMAGEKFSTIDNAHFVRVSHNREQTLHAGVGHRVIVEIEADIGRLADLDGNALDQSGDGSAGALPPQRPRGQSASVARGKAGRLPR